MRYVCLALLLLCSLAAIAQQATFPDDYTPSPCAPPEGVCESYTKSQLPNAAFAFLGLQLDLKWLDEHYDQMLALYAPICKKHATCLATPGNNFLFCDDILIPEYRAVCDKNFPKSKSQTDWDQCHAFTEIYALGMEQFTRFSMDKAQKCVHDAHMDVMHTKTPTVWTVPSTIPRGYKGYIYVYALDPDTRVPLRGDITIEDQIIYAPANPAGNVAAGYPFKWPEKYKRVKNAQGHEDVAPPSVTVKFDYYPSVTFPMPSTPPKMIVSMTPADLHPGINKVVVTARDSETGKPAEGRVMAGDTMVGDTNQPIEIEVPKGGKAPQVWVTSLFDAYSDVVVSK